MWQALAEELSDTNFLPIAVALDARGVEAAAPWIEAAKSTYPSLIDETHRVAGLYNMTNVPQAVWINEDGVIVRPTETAGASDGFRKLDRVTGKMPPDAVAASKAARAAYLDALRDWARNGSNSKYVLAAEEAAARTKAVTPEQALGSTYFRLGEHLVRTGRVESGQRYMDRAKELRPESWAYKRQSWNLEEAQKASGPEFWAAVEALGDEPYYEPPKL